MSSSTGRLFQRGTVWWIDYYHRGKRFRESSESTKKKDATALLRKRLAEIGSGRHVGKDETRLTLADLKKIITDEYKVNKRKSLDRLEVSWLALERHFGLHFRAVDLGEDNVITYILHRQEQGRANSTIRNEINAIRRSLNLAKRAGRISNVPYIPVPKVTAVREGFLKRGELDALLAELPEYLRPVTLFGFMTGWRKREVLNLKWSQVDFEAGEVQLIAAGSKNKEGRTFPFHVLPPLVDLLTEQLDQTRTVEKERGEIINWVFHRNGSQIKSMKTAWNAACRRAGLHGTIFHDLRRNAVKNLEAAGVPRSVAMKLTGHKTESVYRRYAIADKDAQEEGVEKLARLYERQEPRTVIPFRKTAEG
jgi:integrase